MAVRKHLTCPIRLYDYGHTLVTSEKAPATAPATTPRSASSWWVWALLILILLTTAAIRFRLRDMPLERDEGEYAYAGQLILEGIPPYQLAYNMKFPGTYVSYAAIMAVFGQTPAGIRLGLILVNTGVILLVFLLTKRLSNSTAGLIAAAVYAFASLCEKSYGLAGHATHFVILSALGGLLLLLRGIERRSLLTLFWSGVLLGLGVLMKQHGVFFVAFTTCFLYYQHRSGGQTGWKEILRQGAALTLGIWVPLILTGFWLWHAGVFGKFWFWTVQYAHEYATENPPADIIFKNLRQEVPKVVYVSLCFAVAGLMLFRRQADRNRVAFAAGLLGFSILAVMPGFNFRGHYFILLFPALALLTGIAISGSRQFFLDRQQPVRAALSMVLFLGFLGWGMVREGKLFFRDTPVEASRLLYGPTNPFTESIPIAEYLKTHAAKDARIAILGSEPQIYFYSRLHSATGYIYTYALMEPQPFSMRMQKEMISEIETARPDYLVWVQVKTSWLNHPGSDTTIFGWADQYTAAHYDTVGIVDMYRGGTDFFWDAEAKGKLPASKVNLCIYKRKDLP
ncbi:MAG: hypothetical protein JWR26_4536 [Pedosphaera sp.]|nr:hypothetical protein [Pedosphaera sp.]